MRIKYLNIINLSKYIINYCLDHNVNIINLGLIKILYLIAVDYYNLFKIYLFPKEFINFQIWKILGPTIPVVWSEYCLYTANSLRYQKDYKNTILEEDKEMINTLLDCYIYKSVYTLVQLSKEKIFEDAEERQKNFYFS